ncbi:MULTISPECIES: methylamine utilization protein MauJ [unclassified Maridesulfovibrio]|uniref:methylamine utilization protein MauJ n=1 Tax=unclassified Maridesulfovibrio TaxID=2794999 RepID=UPI003B3BEF17
MYSVIAFDSNASFKQDEFVTDYNGFELKLVKETYEDRGRGLFPRVISNQVVIDSDKEHEAHIAGLMFLSEISWLFEVRIHSIMHTGGSIPIRGITEFAGHRGGRIVVDLGYHWPLEVDDVQRLALGLYREGISSNSVYFRFLGLFKILEINMDGKKRGIWLTEYLDNFMGSTYWGNSDNEFLGDDAEKLSLDMYKYGRCAVAHGKESIDVHSFHDYRRIQSYYSILQPAVREYMKYEMEIPSF